MSGLDDILRSLPMDQLARQLGTDEATAAQAASMALPALLGGLQANAADPQGAASLQQAIGQHDDGLLDSGVDLDRVDTNDGAKISSHIFGSNQDQVVQALGGAGGANLGGDLMKRLLPLLAPIVLSYLAKQMQGGGARRGSTDGGASTPSLPPQTQSGGGSSGAPGSLQDMLGQVLGGAAGGSAAQTGRQSSTGQGSGGSILTDLLGGLLGGGRR
ncbi:MAG: DUF937 domain-containing protein [Dermatophilaceae bacterium]|nr:DUF937 domain-containing protein [Intrasporangiaceae bacterium]